MAKESNPHPQYFRIQEPRTYLHQLSGKKPSEYQSANRLSENSTLNQTYGPDLKEYASKFNYFSRQDRAALNSTLTNLESRGFRTFQASGPSQKFQQRKKNNILVQHRINLIEEMIEEKELQWVKVYQGWMKGDKEYQKEFLGSIKEYNTDLMRFYDEIRQFKYPPMKLLGSILGAMNTNYEKFENFYKKQIMYKDNIIAKIQNDFRELKLKGGNPKTEESGSKMSSYE